jgi:hypothetical protein
VLLEYRLSLPGQVVDHRGRLLSHDLAWLVNWAGLCLVISPVALHAKSIARGRFKSFRFLSCSPSIQLFQFLHDKNPQARQIALENLLPHTPKDAPHRAIFFDGQKPTESTVIRDLKLLCRDNLVRVLLRPRIPVHLAETHRPLLTMRSVPSSISRIPR